jgi:hypothetical protein
MSHALRTALLATAVALLSAAVLVALARPAQAAGSAEVRFVEPDKFLDVGRSAHDRERALGSLKLHLERLAQRLPDGQRLRVEVLDVDLAGQEFPRRGTDVRVLRGAADSPMIRLRWTLEQGGATLRSGEERLADLAYLPGRQDGSASDGDLPYEKRMLSRWFREAFEGGK